MTERMSENNSKNVIVLITLIGVMILGRGGNSLRITIPKDIIEVMDLKEGDVLELDTKDGVLYANKKQSQFLTKEEQA